jgi:hypothetical protein
VQVYQPPTPSASKTGQLYQDDDDDDHDDDDDEDDAYKLAQFSPSKYIPERPSNTPVQSPTIPLSMQKV